MSGQSSFGALRGRERSLQHGNGLLGPRAGLALDRQRLDDDPQCLGIQFTGALGCVRDGARRGTDEIAALFDVLEQPCEIQEDTGAAKTWHIRHAGQSLGE